MKNEKITKIINDWDPIDLLSHAPLDEYSKEIALINELLSVKTTVEDLAIGIQNIFITQFDKNIFKKSYYECFIIAKKILKIKEIE